MSEESFTFLQSIGTHAFTSMYSYATGDVTVLSDNTSAAFGVLRLIRSLIVDFQASKQCVFYRTRQRHRRSHTRRLFVRRDASEFSVLLLDHIASAFGEVRRKNETKENSLKTKAKS